MSREVDFEDVAELFRRSLSYKKVEKLKDQEYAIKYLNGILVNQRRLLQSDRAKGSNTKGVENSISIIKKIIGTIGSLPIPVEHDTSTLIEVVNK